MKLSVSMTFLQVAIALASITALTRRRWLFIGAALAALTGVALALAAWIYTRGDNRLAAVPGAEGALGFSPMGNHRLRGTRC
ncbi:DUF4337 family protein, partial [Acinetobacter baumannii]